MYIVKNNKFNYLSSISKQDLLILFNFASKLEDLQTVNNTLRGEELFETKPTSCIIFVKTNQCPLHSSGDEPTSLTPDLIETKTEIPQREWKCLREIP